MTQKVIILIDGGYFDNLNRYLRKNRRKQIDIEKFSLNIIKQISSGATHLRTSFYHAAPYKGWKPTPEEEERYRKTQEFFYSINKVKNHEFVQVGRVRPEPRYCPHCKKSFIVNKQKGVDVALALDLVKKAQKKVADVFVLVSGDEDLSTAVEMAKENLAQVHVFYTYDRDNKMFGSIKLNTTADDRYNMTLDFLEKCAMKTK